MVKMSLPSDADAAGPRPDAALRDTHVEPIVSDDNLLEQLVASVKRIEAGLGEIGAAGRAVAARLDAIERYTRPHSRHTCDNPSPPWYEGPWKDWHRGHGCVLDDGKPRSPAAVAEIDQHK